MRRFYIGAAAAVLCISGAGASAAETVVLDGIAAYVNDRAITIGEVAAMLAPVERQLRERYRGEELRRRVAEGWRQALDQRVERSLILEEFKRRDARVPERAVEDEISALVSERYGGDRAAFLDALAEERLTLDDFRAITRDSLAVLLLRRQEVNQRVRLSPTAAWDFYRENIERYRQPESLNLRVIALQRGANDAERAVKRAEAERIRAAAANGADFAALAQAHSEGARAADGGNMGWLAPTALRREIAEAVAALAPGQVSPVIESEDQLFIAYLEGRKPAAVQPFEEVRGEIEQALARAEEDRLHARWIAALRSRHFVRVLQPDPPD